MWGVELADPREGRPASALARATQAAALRRGLILEVGGRDDAVVRLLQPLNVTADVVDTACSIVIAAIGEAHHSLAPSARPKGAGAGHEPLPLPAVRQSMPLA